MQNIEFKDRLINPSKVVCVGRNYVEHIEELGNEIPKNMVIFNKPNSAISSYLRYFDENTRFEGELCFLIEKGEIVGVGFGLDLTKADIQNELKKRGLPWERAKAFDGSAVFSPFVSFKGNLSSLSFKLYINGSLAQYANYDLMIYKPNEILKEIKSFMSLEDGDIIMSGTPKGVSNYKVGDRFEATIYSDEEEILKWSAEVKSS